MSPSRRVALVGAAFLALGLGASAQDRRPPSGDAFDNPYAWPSLERLVARSDSIVAGEVLDMRSAWTAERRGIFTTVTLRPDRRFRGGERSLIRFRIPGGTVGDTRLEVMHSPAFGVGERVLVFLTGESGLPRVVAGEAGKRHLRTGEDGEATILPGFQRPGAASDGTVGLDTLDDLARAMPALLAGTRSRQ